ncbi:MAG: restriction endonuclease subunit S [Marinilabiliales bacterium]|nr:restriction endonuclease subunit S [Marinilabiliales bacterium]
MNLNIQIPEHWQIKRLIDVCKCVTGTTPSKNDSSNYGSYLPFVKPPQVVDTPINYAPEMLSDKGANKARILPVDSVLVTCIGNLGRTAINKVPVAFNQQINAIIPSMNIDGRFLFYQAQSNEFRKQLENLSSATTVAIVNKGKFETINIVLPPLPEQLAIVSKIEELLSDLENGKQQLLLAQQQLKIYRQSLLKWAFEGKLTNKGLNVGELPKGWEWVKNKDLLKYVTSGSRDWKQYYSTKGSHFVRTQDINSNKLEIANSAFVDLPEKVEGKRSLIEEGDILMTITGANVGKVAVVDFSIKEAYVSQSVALLKYHDKRITKYLWYFFQAQGYGKSFIEKLVYGVGRPVLSLENMREVDVLICPIEDQKQIIDELESKLTVCDKIEETISQSLLQAESLRQSILKKAFEGKLV